MIPLDHKGDVIQSGLQFIRSITEAYGAEEGLKLWDTIASTLDPDVKAQVFFAMITGQYTTTILIPAQHSANRIATIKAIRSVTGMGLKEAKDLSDEMEYKTIKLTVQPEHRPQAIKLLRDSGINL